MKYLILFLFSLLSYAETRNKVVVVDTGLNVTKEITPYLCNFGHKDFSSYDFKDENGHGTHVAHLISRYLNPKKHCLVILKLTNKDNFSSDTLTTALIYAGTLSPKMVNLSVTGDSEVYEERTAIENLLNKKITVSVAAGNEGHNLSIKCDAFPACYKFKNKNFYVVANYRNGIRESSSNYNGPVNAKENGVNQIAAGVSMSGTSMSTAIFTGKYMRDNF